MEEKKEKVLVKPVQEVKQKAQPLPVQNDKQEFVFDITKPVGILRARREAIKNFKVKQDKIVKK
jgi:hypothetical protein